MPAGATASGEIVRRLAVIRGRWSPWLIKGVFELHEHRSLGGRDLRTESEQAAAGPGDLFGPVDDLAPQRRQIRGVHRFTQLLDRILPRRDDVGRGATLEPVLQQGITAVLRLDAGGSGDGHDSVPFLGGHLAVGPGHPDQRHQPQSSQAFGRDPQAQQSIQERFVADV